MNPTAATQERAPAAQGLMENIRGSRLGTALAIAGSAIALMASAEKADASTAQPDGSTVRVVKLKAKSVGFSNKLEKCFAKAEKKEQPAPPVDPYSECEGKVTVKVVAKAVAECPKGWLGGRAAARASVREKIHVLAKSRSIASGDAETEAKTRIRDRVKTKATARVNCVKDQDVPTPTSTQIITPAPKLNVPPVITVEDKEHLFVNGFGHWDAYGSDSDGDVLQYTVSSSSNTTNSGINRPDSNDLNRVQTKVTAGDTPGPASVTFCVSDNRNAQGNFDPSIDVCATDTFNIERNNF